MVTELVCVKYLLRPARSIFAHKHEGAAVAILTIFYTLLTITLICYGRLIHTIVVNPGLVPRGRQWYVEKERKGHKKEGVYEADLADDLDNRDPKHAPFFRDAGYRVEEFWHKDVFVCGWDGRPAFCSSCYNYKPDRAHHCGELDRCVLKMDHFCPWVGGIISETSFKFFVQFTFWAAILCLHTLVVMAYYFAQRRQHSNFIDVHWILVLAFAALFFLFSAGMCGSSLRSVFINSTTIENLNRKSKVWYLAVYIPERVFRRIQEMGRNDLRMIAYPRPPSEQLQILEQHGATISDSQRDFAQDHNSTHSPTTPQPVYDSRSLTSFPPQSAGVATQSTVPPGVPPTVRMFAILETKPGANPWDIGGWNNFQEVMGYKFADWFLPIKPSPLERHDSLESMYKVGRVVDRLRREAGIADEPEGRRRSSRRRRRRKSDATRESRSSRSQRSADER